MGYVDAKVCDVDKLLTVFYRMLSLSFHLIIKEWISRRWP